MRRYLENPPGKLPGVVRIVHNFYRAARTPGRDRLLGLDGFRVWITDEPNENEQRCYCGWLDGREHYGTVGVIDADGDRFWLYDRPLVGADK